MTHAPPLNTYRVTRYDPQYRDEQGRHLRDEWQHISDVGEVFVGETLTLDTYLQVETEYVSVVLNNLSRNRVEQVVVGDLEDYRHKAKVRNGDKLKPQELGPFIRKCLRGECWARLSAVDSQAFVHFGYDLYMYLGLEGPPLTVADWRERGLSLLFAEPILESPYMTLLP